MRVRLGHESIKVGLTGSAGLERTASAQGGRGWSPTPYARSPGITKKPISGFPKIGVPFFGGVLRGFCTIWGMIGVPPFWGKCPSTEAVRTVASLRSCSEVQAVRLRGSNKVHGHSPKNGREDLSFRAADMQTLPRET